VFGEDSELFDPYREGQAVKPWGLTFGAGEHLCIGRPLVTGVSARTDGIDDGTAGTLVVMLNALYESGMVLDPDNPPKPAITMHMEPAQFS
jgi:hypothetical protein